MTVATLEPGCAEPPESEAEAAVEVEVELDPRSESRAEAEASFLAPSGPRRIVSLLSSDTEMVCALGLGDRLVGVSHECDHPAWVAELPRATRTRVDPEAPSAEIDRLVSELSRTGGALYSIDEPLLRALRPDWVLTQSRCEVCAVDLEEVEAVVARMADMPADGRAGGSAARPVVMSFAPDRLEDVFCDLLRIGSAAGALARVRAEAYVGALSRRVARVRAMGEAARAGAASGGPPRVLALEWLDPPMPAGCWIPDMIETAGGVPALDPRGLGRSGKARSVDWDEVAACDADAIVLCPCGFTIERARRELPALLARPAIRALPAFRNRRIGIADGNALFNRPGPRLVETLELLAHAIHPEAARDHGVPRPDPALWADAFEVAGEEAR